MDDDGVDESVRGNILHLDYYPSTQQAIEDREILVISSLDDERLTDYEREDYGEYDFHSTVAVPLVSNDQVVGLIDLFDVRERDYNDVRWFLPEAGRTVADALRNADLLAGLRRGNTALRELVELGDRLNEAGTLEDLSRAVAERLRSVLAAEDCDIWQVDGGVLRCLASVDSHGWDSDEVGSERELAAYEATVAALAADEPMVVGDLASTDLSETEMEAYRRWGFLSMVSLPLVVDGRPIGLIDIFDTRVRDYTVHLDLIRNVGRLLSGSFEKAMLVERLESGNRRMALVSESALELTSSLDLQATLLATARRLCVGVGVNECEITVIEGDQLHTLMRVSEGEVDEEWIGQHLPLADAAVTREVIETKRPSVVGSLRDPRLTPAVLEINRDCELKSWATLPLIVKDHVIGTVELVESGAERTFTQAELDTAAAICHAAALAIDNAALFAREQQTTRETQLLNDIAARTAASLDLEEVVKAAVDELGQLMAFEEYSLLLLEGAKIGTGHRFAPGGRGARSGWSSTTSARVHRARRRRGRDWSCACPRTCPAGGIAGDRGPRLAASSSRCRPTPASSASST